MVNKWLLISAFVATVAISLHIYTFEVWIWPKFFKMPCTVDKCFPSFPFGGPKVVRGFYRTVWHFFTVNLLLTIIVNIVVGVGNVIASGVMIILFFLVFLFFFFL